MLVGNISNIQANFKRSYLKTCTKQYVIRLQKFFIGICGFLWQQPSINTDCFLLLYAFYSFVRNHILSFKRNLLIIPVETSRYVILVIFLRRKKHSSAMTLFMLQNNTSGDIDTVCVILMYTLFFNRYIF